MIAPDKKFGEKGEARFVRIWNKIYGEKLIQFKARFSPFDFYCGNRIFELKTRKNTLTQYPTTIVGQNKINKINPDYEYWFCFQFTDCIGIIKYTKESFKNFEVKKGGRYDRGIPEESQYVYIPVDKLDIIYKEPQNIANRTRSKIPQLEEIEI